MSNEVVLLIVWGVLTAAFLALLAYNATLTRYEEDQLFLASHNEHAQDIQTRIVRHATRLQPVIRVTGIGSAVLGTAILFMYTWQAWQRLHS